MRKIIMIYWILGLTQLIQAQESFLDQSFGDKGRMNFSFLPNSTTQFARNGVLLSDGRILVCGSSLNEIGTKNIGGLAVVKSNGRIDSSVLINGRLPFDLGVGLTENVSPQVLGALSNGIYVISIVQGKTAFNNKLFLKQLGSSFSFSSGFGINGATTVFTQSETDSVLLFNHNLVIQNDDKVLVSYRKQYQPKLTATQSIVRFNTDGTLDKTFGSSGQLIIDTGALNKQITSSGVINNISIGLINQNKILVTGDTVTANNGVNTSNLKLIKYNSNGTTDLAFASMGIFKINTLPFSLRASAIDKSDNIYVAGISPPSLCILKIKSNGVLDTGFANKGIFLSTSFNTFNPVKMVFNSSQEPIILGSVGNQIQVISLKTNGSLNSSFGNNGSIVIPLNKSINAPSDILPLANGGSYILSRLLLNDNGDQSAIEIIKLKSSASTPVKNAPLLPELSIYPNPAHGVLFIQKFSGIQRIELMDFTGKIVFQSAPWSDPFLLPLLPAGGYLLNAYDGNRVLIGQKKIIIE